MRKTLTPLFVLAFCAQAYAWWAPGHLLVALIAYERLEPQAKARVDALTDTLQRDYPYMNHFAFTGVWPDDLKEEGVHSYDTWHYTNIPYNPDGVALPPTPDINVVWAIKQMQEVLQEDKAREIEKARHLAFLVHFVADLHQPLHSTTMYTHELPGGNRGGNGYRLKGEWRNLHMLWDDGCGLFSELNDIHPYGKEKTEISKANLKRLSEVALQITIDYPEERLEGLGELDPDIWALESHHLAVKYGYSGVNEIKDDGREWDLRPGNEPSAMYLQNGQEVVKKRIAMAGYRLARMLNDVFGDD